MLDVKYSKRTSCPDLTCMYVFQRTHTQGPTLKKLDPVSKDKYVRQLISGLSATRLAKNICAQFRARVTASHETFLNAIEQLKARHSGRLKESEEQRATIRKVCS